MQAHLRTPCAALLCAATLQALPAAHAQDIHKCTVDGKLSYSDRPCPATATAAATLAVPTTPAAADPAGARDLARMRKEAAALEKARHDRDDREQRLAAKAAQAAASQRRKCDKLRLNRQWADDDVRRATTNLEQARIKARRAADSLAVECGQ